MSMQTIIHKFINELVVETGTTPTAIILSQDQGHRLEWEIASRMVPTLRSLPRGGNMVLQHYAGEIQILYRENQEEYLDNRMDALIRGEICS